MSISLIGSNPLYIGLNSVYSELGATGATLITYTVNGTSSSTFPLTASIKEVSVNYTNGSLTVIRTVYVNNYVVAPVSLSSASSNSNYLPYTNLEATSGYEFWRAVGSASLFYYSLTALYNNDGSIIGTSYAFNPITGTNSGTSYGSFFKISLNEKKIFNYISYKQKLIRYLIDFDIYGSDTDSNYKIIKSVVAHTGDADDVAQFIKFNTVAYRYIVLHLKKAGVGQPYGPTFYNYIIGNDLTIKSVTLKGYSTMNILQGSTFIDPGATCEDGSTVTISGTVTATTLGTYTKTYTSSSGGIAYRTINVVSSISSTPSVLTIIGNNPYYIGLNEIYVDSGASSADGYTISYTSNVNTSVIANGYNVVYSITNINNITTTATRTVNVIKIPVITLIGNSTVFVQQGTTYIDAGVTVTDAAIPSPVSTVNTETIGNYTVTYTLVSGQFVVRTVKVENLGLITTTNAGAGITGNIFNAISGDGNFAAITTTNVSQIVNIYRYLGGKWIFQQKIDTIKIGLNNGNLFGSYLSFNYSGNVLCISDPYYYINAATVTTGIVYVYKYDGIFYNYDQKIEPASIVANNYFGCDMKVSNDGKIIIVGAKRSASLGSVTYFKINTNSVYSIINTFNSARSGENFGITVSISDDNNFIAVSSWDTSRIIRIYLYNLNTFALTKTYSGSFLDGMGVIYVALNNDASKIAFNSSDGIRIYNTATDVLTLIPKTYSNSGLNRCKLSADGLTILTSSGSNNYVVCWRYNGTAWVQYGRDNLCGNNSVYNGNQGTYIDMSRDGKRVISSSSTTLMTLVSIDNNNGWGVNDVVAPIIKLLGSNPMNLYQGITYVEPGYLIDDGVSTAVITGTVDKNTIGSYNLTYTVTDSYNNVTSTTRTVNVNTIIEISVIGSNPMYMGIGSTYTELGATINSGGVYTTTYNGNSSFPSSATASQVIVTYTCGSVTATRTVNIVNILNQPVLSATPNSSFLITASDIYAGYDGYKAFDNDNTTYWSSLNSYNSGDGLPKGSYSFNPGTGNILGSWIKITLTESKYINYYKLSAASAIYLPISFTLYGSNDNVNYTLINTKSNYTWTTPFLNSNSEIFNFNSVSFRYYVFQVNKTTLGTEYVGLNFFIGHTSNTSINSVSPSNLTSYVSNSPNFIVSTSSDYSATYVGWQMFDSSPSTYWAPVTSFGVGGTPNTLSSFTSSTGTLYGPWFKMVFDKSINVNYFKMATGINQVPLSFALYGSDTNSDYKSIYSVSNYTWTSVSSTSTFNYDTFNISSNINKYKNYVFQITKCNSNNDLSINSFILGYTFVSSSIYIKGSNPMTILKGTTYVEPSAICDNNTIPTISSNTVDSTILGVYTKKYLLGAGVTVNRTINVVNYFDLTPPVITLIGSNPMYIGVGDTFTEPGANVDGGSSEVTITYSPSTISTASITISPYTITYSSTDSTGITNTLTRSLYVIVRPVITLIGGNNINMYQYGSYIECGAKITNSSSITIDSSALITNTVGSYSVIYSATNAISVTRTITVLPNFVLIGGSNVKSPQGLNYIDPGAFSYNGSTIITTIPPTLNVNTVGSYTYSYETTVNTIKSTLSRTVTIVANTSVYATGLTIPKAGNYDGSDIVISDDGKTVIVGAANTPYNAPTNAGQVFIYKYNGSAWIASGNITGITLGDSFGWSLAATSDLSTLVIGAPKNNSTVSYPTSSKTSFFIYKLIAGSYSLQKTIDGLSSTDKTGYSSSISRDGLTIAIGCLNDLNTFSINTGSVRIYKYTTDWNIADTFYGTEAGDSFGLNVSLNTDGTILAATSYSRKNGVNIVGSVSFYNLVLSTRIKEILGTITNGNFGISLSMSDDGNIVAVSGNGYSSTTGIVSTYKMNSNKDDWIQYAPNISGVVNDYLGWSVSLSGDGTTLAIASTGVNTQTGCVKIYKYINSSWSQYGDTIVGSALYDWFGWNVSLNSNGNCLAVSSTTTNVIKVFYFNGSNWTQTPMTVLPTLTKNGGDQVLNQRIPNYYKDWGAYTNDGTLVYSSSSVNTEVGGNYSVNYKASNGAGSVTASRSVAIVDSSGPSITVTPDVNFLAYTSISLPTYSSTETVTFDIKIYNSLNQLISIIDNNITDTYKIKYNATDSNGNASNEVIRTVIILNNVKLNGGDITTERGLPYTDAGYTSTNNIVASMEVTQGTTIIPSFTNAVAGSFKLRYYIVDNSVNIYSDYRTITVQDIISPVISHNGDQFTTKNINLEWKSTYNIPDVTTNEGELTTVITYSTDGVAYINVTSVDSNNFGYYRVIYTAYDGFNTSTATLNITIVDVTKPQLEILPSTNIYILAYNTFSLDYTFSANELISNPIGTIYNSIDQIITSIDNNVTGTYTIKYTATDSHGNASNEVIRTVTISNNVKLNGGDITTERGLPYTDAGYTSTNNIVASMEVRQNDIIISSFTNAVAGIFKLRYYIVDNGNNIYSDYRTITVQDNIFPIISHNGNQFTTKNINLEWKSTYNIPDVTTNEGELTTVITYSTDGVAYINVSSVDSNNFGYYRVIYTAYDGFNTSTATLNITIVDVTKPQLEIIPSTDISILAYNTFSLDYTFLGNELIYNPIARIYNSLNQEITSIDNNVTGTYTIKYTATDSHGNASNEVIRTVTISNNVKLNGGDITTERGLPYTDAGYTSTNNILASMEVTQGSTTFTSFTNEVAGIFKLRYYIIDNGNNIYSDYRTITVQDIISPVIKLRGSATINIELNQKYKEEGADVDEISILTINNTALKNIIGSYEIKYNAIDTSNNIALSVKRTVNVVPNISLYGPLSMNIPLGYPYIDPGYKNNIVVLTDLTSINTTSICSFIIEYKNILNNDEYFRNVTVVQLPNNYSPLAISGGDITIGSGLSYIDPGFPSGTIVSGSVDVNTPNTYTLTYTNVVNGLSSSTTRNVTVSSTITAVPLTISGDSIIRVGTSILPFIDPGYNSSTSVSGVVDQSSPGDYYITYTSTIDGITSSNVRKVIVENIPAVPLVISGGDIIVGTSLEPFIDPGYNTSNTTFSGNVDQSTPGDYYITYTGTIDGITSSIVRKVTVSENLNLITLIGDNTMDIIDQSKYLELGAFSSDGSLVSISGSVAENNLTYSALNAVTKTRNVNLVPIPPGYTQSLYINGDYELSILVGSVFVDPGYYPNAIVYSYNNYNLLPINTSIPRTFNLIYVHKNNGITSMIQRIVNVVNPPVNFTPILLTSSSRINVVAGAPYIDPGFPPGTTITGTVDPTIPGPVTLLYTYKDPDTGIISSTERIITVVPPPENYEPIQLNYPTEINVVAGFPYVDPGFPPGTIISGAVDTSSAGGSYELTYTSTVDGITSSIKRKINVITANNYTPLTLFGPKNMKVTRYYNFVDPGHESNLSVYGTVDTNTPGTYILYYTKMSERTIVSSNIITNSAQRTIVVEEPPPNYVNPLDINTLGISQTVSLMIGEPYVHPSILPAETIVYGSIDHTILGTYYLTYTYTYNNITSSFIRIIYIINGRQSYYASSEELINIGRDPVTTISSLSPSFVYSIALKLDINSLLFEAGILVPKQGDIIEQIHKKGLLPNSFIYLVGTDNNYTEIEIVKIESLNSVNLSYGGIIVTEVNEEKAMDLLAKHLKVNLDKSVSIIPIINSVYSTIVKVTVSSVSSGVINSLSDGSQDTAIDLFMSKIKLKSSNTNWYLQNSLNNRSMSMQVKSGLAQLFDKDSNLNNLLGSSANAGVFLDLDKIETKMSNPNDLFYTKIFSTKQLKEVLDSVADKGNRSLLFDDSNNYKYNFNSGDSISSITRVTDGDTALLNSDLWLITLQQL